MSARFRLARHPKLMTNTDVPATQRCDPAATGRPAAPGSKRRASRAGRWRAAVLIGVHVLFALHLAHLYSTGETISPLEPSESMEFAKRSVINAGFIFFSITILSTLIFGRFFCGWACHVVAMQDLALWVLKKFGITPKPLRSRILMVVPLAAAFYMFALPLLARLWYGQDVTQHSLELTTTSFWETFPQWTIAIVTLLLCGLGAVYFLGAKGFCTYACPYGGIFWLVDRFSPGRIRVDDKCDGCGHCTAVCTSNVAVAQEVKDWGMVKDAGCMKCMDCVSVCPTKALSFGFGSPGVTAKQRTEQPLPRKKWLAWRSDIAHALVFVLVLLSFRSLVVFPDEALPFLFSLALAGVATVALVKAYGLLVQPEVKLQNLVLKRDGKLERSGRVLLGVMLPFTLLWAHSGFIRYHDAAATTLEEELANRGVERVQWRKPWFDPALDALGEEYRPQVESLRAHSLTIRRWALVEGLRNPQRLFWAAVYAGDLLAARPLLAELRELMPGHPLYLAAAGRMAALDGDLDGAIRHYEAALRESPEFRSVAVGLAELYARFGRIDEALTALDRALAFAPGDAGLLIARATSCFLAGRLPEAEAAFRGALESEPTQPVARAGLATALFALNRAPESQQVIREGLELAPESLEMKLMMKGVLMELGRTREAAEVLRDACALAPERADLRAELTRLEAALGGGQ